MALGFPAAKQSKEVTVATLARHLLMASEELEDARAVALKGKKIGITCCYFRVTSHT